MFPEHTARASKSVRTVLVVDDLDTNRSLLERLLGAEGYRVVTEADGEAGLAAVRREAPDVVLSDIRMPKRDGFALCLAIKSDPATRLIPVVLMTGASETADRIQAIEAGADDFITKPI